MRAFGLTIASPVQLADRLLTDLAAVERLIRTAPDQMSRIIRLGEELVAIGDRVLEIAERLDERAESIGELGERLDRRAAELISVGGRMSTMGDQVDERGAEIVASAAQVSQTAHELMLVLPTLERALDLATPLEGAIDRFGRFVDRFPGASNPRRRPQHDPDEPSGEE
jgi:methyl-accepting chemotaxis protein